MGLFSGLRRSRQERRFLPEDSDITVTLTKRLPSIKMSLKLLREIDESLMEAVKPWLMKVIRARIDNRDLSPSEVEELSQRLFDEVKREAAPLHRVECDTGTLKAKIDAQGFDELFEKLGEVGDQPITHLSIGAGAEKHKAFLMFSGEPLVPSYLTIEGRDRRWIAQTAEQIGGLIARHRTVNRFFNNAVMIPFLSILAMILAIRFLSVLVPREMESEILLRILVGIAVVLAFFFLIPRALPHTIFDLGGRATRWTLPFIGLLALTGLLLALLGADLSGVF